MIKRDKSRATKRSITSPNPKKVVRQLDQRILECIDPTVDKSKKAEILSWVHHHLMVPVIIEWDRQLARPLPSQEEAREMEQPSLKCIDILRLMLNGAVAIDENLVFRVLIPPPPGYAAALDCSAEHCLTPAPVASELVAWLRRRLAHTAQRTRFHEDSELKALLEWAEAELILYAVRRFELGRYLVPAPSFTGAPVMPAVIMTVARGYWSIAWTGDEPVFKVLTPPPFN